MPSIQARLYSSFLRLYLKRRPQPKPLDNVTFARRRFEPPQWMRVPPPAGTLISPATRATGQGETTWGEIVSWQNETAPRAVYFLHGGGYIFGKPDVYRLFTSTLARRMKARVFAPDYRLAPEHPFPAALDDAVAGYQDVLARVQNNPKRILLVGDSAGGGLVMATLLKLRALGLPLPVGAICLSPWVDLTCQSASLDTNDATDAMFYGDGIRQCAPLYHGAHPASDPFVSPLLGDLAGLPPLQIFVSQSEVLRDDALKLAEKARAAELVTELYVYDGMPHVWPIFAFLPEAKQAMDQMTEFAERQFRTCKGCGNA